MPNDCLNPYSVAKTSGEELCKMYTKLFGLKTIILRYFNVYGQREPIKGPYAPVVGLFLRQKKAGESLTIVGDGTQRRDFTHVDDVVDANIRMMSYDGSEIGTVFNVGTGLNHSVNELAKLISDNVVFIPFRLGESKETLANNTKICYNTGWTSTKSIVDYIKDNL
jgi:UDP-glucose 4-epimerase